MLQSDQPLVSIAVPVYNGAKYIDECLSSIEKQTYQNWECIINDNCSKDKTVAIAEQYVQRDSRFKLYKNENFLGIVNNWNAAFQRLNSNSVYCKIVPADDWIFPEFIEKMVEIMEKDPETGICSSYRIDHIQVRADDLDIYRGNIFDGKALLLKQLKHQIEITGSANTVLYRHSILKKLPYYPDIFLGDFINIDTVLAYDIMYRSKVGFVFQVLSYTRRHYETVTSNVVKKFNVYLPFRLMIINRYIQSFPEMTKTYNILRLDYAYLVFLLKMTGKRQTLKWHRSHISVIPSTTEILIAIFTRNIIARQIDKLTYRSFKTRIFKR